jgi:hypothetical protein
VKCKRLEESYLNVILERRTETVVGESFAEFDNDDEPSADGDFVGNTSKGSQVFLRDPIVLNSIAGVFAERAGRIAGLGVARQVLPILLSDEVKIPASNVVRELSVVVCSVATVLVGGCGDASMFGHFDVVSIIFKGLISYSGTRKPGGG